MNRRAFLQGLAGILAAGVAPAAIGSGVLMPVKKLWTPEGPRIYLMSNHALAVGDIFTYGRSMQRYIVTAAEVGEYLVRVVR